MSPRICYWKSLAAPHAKARAFADWASASSLGTDTKGPALFLAALRESFELGTQLNRKRSLVARMAGNIAPGLLARKVPGRDEYEHGYERTQDLRDLAAHAVEISLAILKNTDERLERDE